MAFRYKDTKCLDQCSQFTIGWIGSIGVGDGDCSGDGCGVKGSMISISLLHQQPNHGSLLSDKCRKIHNNTARYFYCCQFSAEFRFSDDMQNHHHHHLVPDVARSRLEWAWMRNAPFTSWRQATAAIVGLVINSINTIMGADCYDDDQEGCQNTSGSPFNLLHS